MNYTEDVNFLKKYVSIIELKNENGKIAVSPDLQGRVMTSTVNDARVDSFGWINYNLFQSGQRNPQFNAFGGEERFWLGPEGGQFSLYFPKGKPFEFSHWKVPKEIDTESFDLVYSNENEVSFGKDMQLQNYSDEIFKLRVSRNIRLLEKLEIEQVFGTLDNDVKVVGYQSENSITNKGDSVWKKDKGLISIWMLGMLKPSESMRLIVPYTDRNAITDNYFGQIPPDRYIVRENFVELKADGEHRGKLGIKPFGAKNYLMSIDEENETLTVLIYKPHSKNSVYLNAKWEWQQQPYDGDVVNVYNDGPLENGEQLGSFYEMETSSPGVELVPNESLFHTQCTYHFKGKKERLKEIVTELLENT